MNRIYRRNACLLSTVRFIVRGYQQACTKVGFHTCTSNTTRWPPVCTDDRKTFRSPGRTFRRLNFHGTSRCSRASCVSGYNRVLSRGILSITRHRCSDFDFSIQLLICSMHRYLSSDSFVQRVVKKKKKKKKKSINISANYAKFAPCVKEIPSRMYEID